MNFTDNPFERMMRQRPGTDSGHPCKHCRHKWECGYALSDFLIMILSWLVKQSLRAFLFQEVQL